jgi:RNA polymerase sigma factor (TIGR02999 family)
MKDVTYLIQAMEQGDPHAAEELLPILYEELRILASQKLSKEPPGQTLQPTALVHEAYLRLIGLEPQHWDNRGHFFAAAAEAMRRILIENARRKQNIQRGGKRQRLTLRDSFICVDGTVCTCDLLSLNEALVKFEQKDPQKANLVKLRFFAGLTIEQSSQSLGISLATAKRYWAYARSWLRVELSGDSYRESEKKTL